MASTLGSLYFPSTRKSPLNDHTAMKDKLEVGPPTPMGSRPFILNTSPSPHALAATSSSSMTSRRPRSNSSSAALATPTKKTPAKSGADAFTTPSKNATPGADSPGTWRHPRLDEITRRRRAATFSDKNVKLLCYYSVHFVALWGANKFVREYLSQVATLAPYIKEYWSFALGLLIITRLYLIFVCMSPLFRAPDDLSDIPLSPTQRKLLGLPPSSTPSGEEKINTPPRYSRTPSHAGSVGSNRSFATNNNSPAPARDNSPLFFGASINSISSNNGGGVDSPFRGSLGYSINSRASLAESSFGGLSPSASPLYQRQLRAEARAEALLSRRYSFGASTSSQNLRPTLNSLLADPLSPSPTAGKRTTVGLNNKWLYERGRRSSGTWAN